MKFSLGSDHAGFRYKEKVKELLASLGHEVKDCGTFSEEPVDYPLFIRPAAEAVASVARFVGTKSRPGSPASTMTLTYFRSVSV